MILSLDKMKYDSVLCKVVLAYFLDAQFWTDMCPTSNKADLKRLPDCCKSGLLVASQR